MTRPRLLCQEERIDYETADTIAFLPRPPSTSAASFFALYFQGGLIEMRLLVRLANCNPVRVVEVNLPLTSSVAMLKQRVEALTGVNEFKQKIYCAGQFMDPDALLSSFELKDGMELKLLVKMSKITNKIAIDNGAKAAAAVPAHQANSGLMGLKELAGRLREAGSEDDEDDDEDESASGGSDTYSKDEEEAILYAAMRRVADSHKRARGAQK